MGSVIPVFRPVLPSFEAVRPYLQEMDRNRIYTNGGPLVLQLEHRYANFLGVSRERVVAVSSGTAGLTAAVLAVGASEWVVPDWTFAATPLAVLRAAKSVTFVDVQLGSGAVDAASLTDLSPRKAAVPVMPFGGFSMAPGFMELDHVVIDAAASLANAAGKLTSLADRSATVFSLHATKILGCGEGGLVVCGSNALAEEVRSIINFGFDGGRETIRPGFNGKMPEISAAYGLAALDRAGEELHEWRVQGKRAHEAASMLPMEVLSPHPGEVSPYWILRWPHNAGEMPQEMDAGLSALGVETRRWWSAPCSSMPEFAGPIAPTPHAHWLARNTIGLPFFVDMSQQEFDRVLGAMNSVLSGYRV